MLTPLELEQARKRLALETDEAVGIVLQDRQRPLRGELDEAPAPLLRERHSGRVLKGRDRVEKRGRTAGRELVHVEAVLVYSDLGQLPALFEQDLPWPVVGRPLDDHRPGPH